MDKKSGYHTKTILCMPIRGAPQGAGKPGPIIGVIQVRSLTLTLPLLLLLAAHLFIPPVKHIRMTKTPTNHTPCPCPYACPYV